MKLYTYDHCPFCVRARMALGMHGISFEHIILANDDEPTPIGLIGAKMVPILIKDDGTAMGESLDIVSYIEGKGEAPILLAPVREDVKNWAQTLGIEQHRLIMPRLVRLGLPEFAEKSAIDYFIGKKSEFIGDFDDNFARTADYLPAVNQALAKLAAHIRSPDALNGNLGYEDIYVFPVLRSLSCVQELQWPDAVRDYVECMSQRAQVPLYFDRAL